MFYKKTYICRDVEISMDLLDYLNPGSTIGSVLILWFFLCAALLYVKFMLKRNERD